MTITAFLSQVGGLAGVVLGMLYGVTAWTVAAAVAMGVLIVVLGGKIDRAFDRIDKAAKAG